MDLRRLRYFVAVAEERHFGRAAERLFIAQPALSQQIRALEAELGVLLFTRSTRRVDLTPAGARLYPRVAALLVDADAAFDEARRIHEGAEGIVRLGFIGSATYSLMPALSRALRADAPGLRVDLRGEMLSPEVAEALASDRIDVGVLRPFTPSAGVEVRTLRTEPLVVALPEGHRLAGGEAVALASLAGDSWVGYPDDTSATADAVGAATQAAGITPGEVTEVRETATLVSFVAAGLGVALVPEGVRDVHLPGVVYLPLSDEPAPSIDLVVAWRADAPARVVERVLERLSALTAPG